MEKFKNKIQVLIPMAGEGKRFADVGYDVIKPLIPVNGIPMIKASIDSLEFKDVDYHFIVRDFYYESICEILEKNYNGKIHIVDRLTEGPAITCLKAVFELDMNRPLVIANCDQIMKWNNSDFISMCQNDDIDGAIVTYETNVPHNSYAKIDEKGFVCLVKEKEVISNISLNGIHFWKKAEFFLKSTCKMIVENDRAPNGEFYIGPSYNHMVQSGLKVKNYHLKSGQHWSVGTPGDLERYLNEKI